MTEAQEQELKNRTGIELERLEGGFLPGSSQKWGAARKIALKKMIQEAADQLTEYGRRHSDFYSMDHEINQKMAKLALLNSAYIEML